jgi:hypothetical protein
MTAERPTPPNNVFTRVVIRFQYAKWIEGRTVQLQTAKYGTQWLTLVEIVTKPFVKSIEQWSPTIVLE